MKILFIYSGAENLGIEYISSVLKSKGHEVHLLFDPAVFSGDTLINSKLFSWAYNVDTKIINKAIDLKPDLIGFSAYTGNYRWCLNIAQGIKKVSNIPIVFGGVHTTAVPERVLANKFIDFAIIGEGEYAMLDLIGYLKNGNNVGSLLDTPNICFRQKNEIHINQPRAYVQDLDTLPFPDKMLFYDKVPMLEEQYFIATSRGCPYSCTYCSNDMYRKTYCNENKHVRRRSPDNVIAELMLVKKRRRVKLVSFADDVFTFSKSWLEEFIPKYKSNIDLPFFCCVHPLAITQEQALLLKKGGCCLVTMGVQSGSERIRTEVFKRQGTNEMITESILHIKNAGIKISVDNIFGAPSESEEDLRLSFDLYKKLKTDRILTFWLTYYPKTSIIAFAKSKNCLSQQDVENIEQGYSGFAHGTGSVSKEQAKIYCKYELLFQLRSLIHNDKLFRVLSISAIFMPFKRLTSRIIIILNALANKDFKFFYMIKYVWTKKYIP